MMIRLLFFFSLLLTPQSVSAFDLWEEESGNSQQNLQALPIVLKEDVEVSGEYILLGDIFSGLNAEQNKKVVSEAPELGKEAILTVEWLENIAKKNKLNWKASDKTASVKLKRQTGKITKEEIEDFLLERLQKHNIPEDATLSIRTGETPLLIPLKAEWTLEEKEVDYNPFYQTFKAELDLYINGKKEQRHAFSGKIEVYIEIPTARQTLTLGQIITKEDIVMKSVLQGVGRKKIEVVSADDLIGKEVKKAIREGQAITPRDVRDQVMVSKGKIVTLNFTKSGIILSVQGKALENGGLGDTVRVMNTQSKSVIQGTVIGPETVSILPTDVSK